MVDTAKDMVQDTYDWSRHYMAMAMDFAGFFTEVGDHSRWWRVWEGLLSWCITMLLVLRYVAGVSSCLKTHSRCMWPEKSCSVTQLHVVQYMRGVVPRNTPTALCALCDNTACRHLQLTADTGQ